MIASRTVVKIQRSSTLPVFNYSDGTKPMRGDYCDLQSFPFQLQLEIIPLETSKFVWHALSKVCAGEPPELVVVALYV
jgi:hypothetical protein